MSSECKVKGQISSFHLNNDAMYHWHFPFIAHGKCELRSHNVFVASTTRRVIPREGDHYRVSCLHCLTSIDCGSELAACTCRFAVRADIVVRGHHLTATGNHVLYGITRCYLPRGSSDIPAFIPAKAGTQFSNPGGMQG